MLAVASNCASSESETRTRESVEAEEGSSVEDARYQCKLKMNLTITKSGPR